MTKLWLILATSYLTWPSCVKGTQTNGTRACNVLIGFDDVLYNHHNQNFTYLVEVAQSHIDEVNRIFQQNVFVDDYSDIYLRLARVQIMFGSCDSFRYENCTQNKEKYLEIFDQYDFSSFCLGYMFTYRDFDEGIAGYAYIGNICQNIRNSGFITFLNYNRTLEMEATTTFFAHELGHSFGALHDVEEDSECDDSYIMNPLINNTTPTEFSNCSVKEIHEKLKTVIDNPRLNCLLEVDPDLPMETAICGNGIVEPGEDCDCGHDEVECNDPCCYPAQISASDRNANDTALPCSRNTRARCVTPGGLLYGVYFPFGVIIILSVLVTVLLRNDWARDKTLFKHITEGIIRIENSRRNRS